MRPAFLRASLNLASLAAAAALAGCASPAAEAQLEAQAEAARLAAEAAIPEGPPVALNNSVAQSAAVYMAYARDLAALQGGFESPDEVQATLRRVAGYDPEQLSRGLIAYASILALQSPEFVQGVRDSAAPESTRQRLVGEIVANPKRASRLPGADAAAGLIIATLRTDIDALSRAANSVENDAYALQADGRRGWAIAEIWNREGRLEAARRTSGDGMLPRAEETARLFTAAHGQGTLPVQAARREPPYPPAVEKALALAALAALGAAGENAVANTDALQFEWSSHTCLQMAKLNLLQCLAASRPNYEDVFCLGRHVVRDLASCSRGAAIPAPIIQVSGLRTVDEKPAPVPAPRIVISPAPSAPPPPRIAPSAGLEPVRTPAAPPPDQPARSLTERLNTGRE